MKKGWRNDLAYVERRERLAKERAARRMEAIRFDIKHKQNMMDLESRINEPRRPSAWFVA